MARVILGGRSRGIAQVVGRHAERLGGRGQVAAWWRGGDRMSVERIGHGSKMRCARNMEAHCDLLYGGTSVEIT